VRPIAQGRTATQEVGHNLGLQHTFQGNCAPAKNCYQNGDLICDTNPDQQPDYGCADSLTCGSLDPIDNYMQ
jgi:hypothetical protein